MGFYLPFWRMNSKGFLKIYNAPVTRWIEGMEYLINFSIYISYAWHFWIINMISLTAFIKKFNLLPCISWYLLHFGGKKTHANRKLWLLAGYYFLKHFAGEKNLLELRNDILSKMFVFSNMDIHWLCIQFILFV